MVAWKNAVVEPDHEDQIEIEAARLEYRQRNHRAGNDALGRARGAIERGLDHRGELRRVNDASAPGDRGPSRESVERGAHGAPCPRGIIGGLVRIVRRARRIEAEHLQRTFQVAQMLGERAALRERLQPFEHPCEGCARPLRRGKCAARFCGVHRYPRSSSSARFADRRGARRSGPSGIARCCRRSRSRRACARDWA